MYPQAPARSVTETREYEATSTSSHQPKPHFCHHENLCLSRKNIWSYQSRWHRKSTGIHRSAMHPQYHHPLLLSLTTLAPKTRLSTGSQYGVWRGGGSGGSLSQIMSPIEWRIEEALPGPSSILYNRLSPLGRGHKSGRLGERFLPYLYR